MLKKVNSHVELLQKQPRVISMPVLSCLQFPLNSGEYKRWWFWWCP